MADNASSAEAASSRAWIRAQAAANSAAEAKAAGDKAVTAKAAAETAAGQAGAHAAELASARRAIAADRGEVERLAETVRTVGNFAAGLAFIHAQEAAASEWIVNHNMGVRPTVTILSPGGVQVFADVVHASTNQVRVYFAAPMTGSARCI